MKNYNEILEIIRSTREMTLPSWGNVTVQNQKNGSAASVVTKIDTQVETYLAEAFAKVLPDVKCVGEEFGGDRTAKQYWLIDPIDGTGHYVHGIPYCTTMVALIEDNQVVFGAIYDFVSDVMYHALKGEGSFANHTPIRVSNRPVHQAYICYETKLEKPENLEKYLAVRKQCATLNHVCAGYEHILVATGKTEGRIGFDPYGTDYDFAPGSLLIQEAGGIVTNVGSDNYDFRHPNYIAANPAVHAALTTGANVLFPVTT